MIFLALAPRAVPRSTKIRLFGRSLLLFSLAPALTGFLIVYLPARLCGITWGIPEYPLALSTLATPLAAWVAVVLFEAPHKKRAMSVTSGLAVLWAAIIIFGPRSSDVITEWELLIANSLIPFLTGIIFASAFVLAFGQLANATERARR